MGVLGAGLATLANGCRGIVAGENVDLATELCELLVRCGEELSCPYGIAEPLRDQDASSYLENAEQVGCLEGCANARLCRDFPPVCTVEDCSVDEDCCDFTSGQAACGLDGRCCLPAGVPCGSPEDPVCCGGLGCNNGHCGDVVCRVLDQACDVGQQCCSERCDEGLCVVDTCDGIGSVCVVTSDCCETDPPTTCAGGRCVPEGECVCDPFAPITCCDGGAACFSVGEDLSTCAPFECPPPGAECGSDEDCAQGPGCDKSDLFCDFTFIPFCAECLGLGAPCNAAVGNSGCCAGTSCKEGTCTE